MKVKTRKFAKVHPTGFGDQARFNWGFHDAALAVQEGWDNAERNFGFSRVGPLAGMEITEDVLARHFDKVYAKGWTTGYHAAKAGLDTTSSEAAWNAAKV